MNSSMMTRALIFIAVFTALGLSVVLIVASGNVQQGLLAVALAGAALGIPLALRMAILRQRRSRIDLIIQRTLIYGALFVTLLVIYLGCVVTFQALFQALTGQETDVAAMIATLVVALLFGPLHNHIRRMMDRRFFRSTFDAERIIEVFGNQLRTEVDLDRLTARLIAVVYETAQPSQVSLWLVNRNMSNATEEQN